MRLLQLLLLQQLIWAGLTTLQDDMRVNLKPLVTRWQTDPYLHRLASSHAPTDTTTSNTSWSSRLRRGSRTASLTSLQTRQGPNQHYIYSFLTCILFYIFVELFTIHKANSTSVGKQKFIFRVVVKISFLLSLCS